MNFSLSSSKITLKYSGPAVWRQPHQFARIIHIPETIVAHGTVKAAYGMLRGWWTQRIRAQGIAILREILVNADTPSAVIPVVTVLFTI